MSSIISGLKTIFEFDRLKSLEETNKITTFPRFIWPKTIDDSHKYSIFHWMANPVPSDGIS